ncbi:sulfur oxidation c-type cytochrome SoxX [Alsobacter sp. SYSU M60028]|uniref:Sulfur oxidation c-type cytochrome SoxX n=1 Tax=Alsobacter ponti TaxID=2962936 RepID=A0ABT1LHJ0_9HYPH|nr:sulfur oxidation c-type cytochrome SoxX [Alsobacter ponti]MCP8940966.1 sulfur oxidation c-type cytochrome SoxX [Alsobacter ponti]
MRRGRAAVAGLALAALAAGGGAGAAELAPLTAQPGDPARGRDVVRDLTKATCLICHALPIPEEPNPGNIGPNLAGVGARFSAGELRARVVDATTINPNTVMPPYFRTEGLNRVLARWRGQTIYSAQEVEDVVAYLGTLRQP